jgi:hypothetical protein
MFVDGVILGNKMRGRSERYSKSYKREDRFQRNGRCVGRESEGESESRHYV